MEPIIFSIAVQLQKHIFGAISSVPGSSKCTKIVGGWGFAPDPTGRAYSAPQTVAGPWGGAVGAIAPSPLEWSLKSFLVTSFPNLLIPGSHKFFPYYKFITSGLFFDY